jgi:hypothetical protein
MAASSGSSFTRRRETVAEKAEQHTAIQRELKKSAAESREKAAKQEKKPRKRVDASKY